MGRAPCCEKMGLKKGPWTAEEDATLVNYINKNGHGNWRALPKRAGLLRCGKSCRLRWVNYLRPDIKRGNFTREEEDTIIKLHHQLGNKWSVMAARLPGRTDNEIKNVWHTHLKKGLTKNLRPEPEPETHIPLKSDNDSEPNSPALSSNSSVTTASETTSDGGRHDIIGGSFGNFDDSFWSEVFPVDDWSGVSDFSSGNSDSELPLPVDDDFSLGGGMDFWFQLFNKADELIGLPDF